MGEVGSAERKKDAICGLHRNWRHLRQGNIMNTVQLWGGEELFCHFVLLLQFVYCVSKIGPCPEHNVLKQLLMDKNVASE